jgi:hypothetical protein
MTLSASFLSSVAFAWRASKAAALAPLTHAAAQAGWFEKLSDQEYDFGKVLFTQNSRRYQLNCKLCQYMPRNVFNRLIRF